jgi:hypothetical protein
VKDYGNMEEGVVIPNKQPFFVDAATGIVLLTGVLYFWGYIYYSSFFSGYTPYYAPSFESHLLIPSDYIIYAVGIYMCYLFYLLIRRYIEADRDAKHDVASTINKNSRDAHSDNTKSSILFKQKTLKYFSKRWRGVTVNFIRWVPIFCRQLMFAVRAFAPIAGILALLLLTLNLATRGRIDARLAINARTKVDIITDHSLPLPTPLCLFKYVPGKYVVFAEKDKSYNPQMYIIKEEDIKMVTFPKN